MGRGEVDCGQPGIHLGECNTDCTTMGRGEVDYEPS